MDKRFLTILVVLVVIFGGFFVVSQRSGNNSSGSSSSSTQPTNHVEGQGSTGVKLVEYGDYECPICSIYYSPLKQVAAQFNSQIYFQFRNLPLTSVHKNAFAAARAAEAAGLQDKYWQMHDKIYENQDPTGQSGWVASNDPLSYFTAYAQAIGLNMTQFKSDYASSRVNDSINADISAFMNIPYVNHDIGKEATPTFFLDGKNVPNSQLADSTTGQPSVAKITQVINAEITSKSKQ